MEQDHLGNFFTKLFYSDAIYPVLPSAGQLSPLDCEFPSVVAPDLSRGMVMCSSYSFDSHPSHLSLLHSSCFLSLPSFLSHELLVEQSKAEKKKKKRKKKKAAQRQRQRGGSVGGPSTAMPGEGLPSRRAHALDIVPQKEVCSSSSLSLRVCRSLAELTCSWTCCAAVFDGKASLWRTVRARGIELRQRLRHAPSVGHHCTPAIVVVPLPTFLA
jgi:hypothetical protein